MNVVFDGSMATVSRLSTRRERWGYLAGAAALIIVGGLIWAHSPSAKSLWVIFAGFLLTISLVTLIMLVAPNRQFVFDAGDAKVVAITTQYPWQRVGRVVRVPFADIDSIGVNRVKNSEGPDEFHVVIRWKQGRNFMLWSLELPEASDRDYQRFIAAEPDLTLLRDLTSFRYENRLD